MDTCLIIDVSCICHRAYHKLGAVAFDNGPLGVVYGFLNTLKSLLALHEPDTVAFCYDSKTSHRREIYPAYKLKERDVEEQTRRKILQKQIKRLSVHLGTMGFNNGYHQPGYEADDLIAALCAARPKGRNIIVSSDRDLYQCLRPGTFLWSPHNKRRVTYEWFIGEYMINPDQWWRVLAIAGGHDNIPGVPGVGIKTALRYVRGNLDRDSKTCRKIEAHATAIRTYRQLVRLPYPGTVVRGIVPDTVTDDSWDAAVGALGMHNLKRRHARIRRSGTIVKGRAT